jgi:hypothetical protein
MNWLQKKEIRFKKGFENNMQFSKPSIYVETVLNSCYNLIKRTNLIILKL